MLDRLRSRALGPGDKAIVVAVSAVLLAALAFVVVRLVPDKCDDGFQEAGGECVGVTASTLDADPGLEGLIQAVADENDQVRQGWEDPQNGAHPMPYVRIALMMPFTSDATSAMSRAQIARALAGAHAAQLRFNREKGGHPMFQLLLANDGKNLDHWQPVVDQLVDMVDDESPLVGVFGMPNSNEETLKAAEALSTHQIPVIGPVLTSTTMKADYFFKTSPSNESFAHALRAYVDEHPGNGRGFLVSDSREKDSYSVNLRDKFLDYFPEYDLEHHEQQYTGMIGSDQGIPQYFPKIVRQICKAEESDTIFFAGRDNDLPALVNLLADECGTRPMRILKVGIGMDPLSTTDNITGKMKHAHITLVAAASVDARFWDDTGQLPEGPQHFMEQFREVREKVSEIPWGKKPLDDGYAVMYYDAFTALAQAYGVRIDPDGDGTPHKKVGNYDVRQVLINMKFDKKCLTCVEGASGTFGFDNTPETDKWAVCRPVPIIEYPPPDGAGAQKKAHKTYRTFQDLFDGGCPEPS